MDTWSAPVADQDISLPLNGSTFTLRIPSAIGTVAPSVVLKEDHNNGECSLSGESSPNSGSNISLPSSLSLVPKDLSTLKPAQSSSSANSNCSSSYDFVQEKDEFCRMGEAIDISFDGRDYHCAFSSVLSHLQRLWELVITAQPLLVMGGTPSDTSQTVQALVSCIAPFAFSADYRPFFTIYDAEFKDICRDSSSSPIAILGVTNPFFSKALLKWPNVIRLGKPLRQIDKKKLRHGSSKLLLEDLKPGLYSHYKPFLKRDAGFFKRLKRALNNHSPEAYISLTIHRFFQELTMSFLIPLEHYISSLMPLHRDISPFRSVPELSRFNMDDFFRTLETAGPQLTCDVKGNWIGLYKSFFSGPHFVNWLSQRETDIAKKLHGLHMDAILLADFGLWTNKRSEVEIVDMILSLNQKLISIRRDGADCDGLRRKIWHLLQALPEDLRQVVGASQACGGTFGSGPTNPV